MEPIYTPDTDARCLWCGYNLRGLPVDHNCPECGEPAIRSVTQALMQQWRSANRTPNEEADLRRRLAFTPAASIAGLCVDALLFAYDAVLVALEAKPAAGHISASDFCAALRDYALWYFGDAQEAVAVFRDWGILTSEDIGRAVLALVAAGLLSSSPADTREAFNGLFRVEDWLDLP